MFRLEGVLQNYAWGDTQKLPTFLGVDEPAEPWAELWFGAHPLAPSKVLSVAGGKTDEGLDRVIAANPRRMLGESVARAFDDRLPFLLKLIAPSKPLSLQVHPEKEHAKESFAAENAAGLAIDSPLRNYRDDNHKPEMVLALEQFEALCGFRTPRKALTVLEGLTSPLGERMRNVLHQNPTAHGVRAVFRMLISEALSPSASEVQILAEECIARLDSGTSPSPRIDRAVKLLNAEYPGDPGVAAALLLNPVSLEPGEAMFVPAGVIHSYLSGFAVEIMASSDNVLRAGLTPKKVDANELLQCVSVKAAPPTRIAPEHLGSSTVAYFAPIDDFELSVVTLEKNESSFRPAQDLNGAGPRIILCIEGDLLIEGNSGRHRITVGQAVFVPADVEQLRIGGYGRLVQASVP